MKNVWSRNPVLTDKTAIGMTTKNRLGKDFFRRIGTAAIGAPTILLLVYIGYPLFEAAVMTAAMLAGVELHQMMARGNLLAFAALACITISCFISLFLTNTLVLAAMIVIFLVLWVGKALMTQHTRMGLVLVNYLQVVLGSLYIGLPLSLFLIIRHWHTGLMWTVVLFANNWATDGFALIGGRLFGTRKLAPRISAGKTVEGVFVGLFVGFTLGLVISLIGGLPLLPAVIGNLIISVFTILGDLLESWVKRVFGAKDSGSILPGHGGILDRIDGLLVAIPIFYFVLSHL
jgi:phosphatidate cytidylyltransferase